MDVIRIFRKRKCSFGEDCHPFCVFVNFSIYMLVSFAAGILFIPIFLSDQADITKINSAKVFMAMGILSLAVYKGDRSFLKKGVGKL